jgi:hypothetical protein
MFAGGCGVCWSPLSPTILRGASTDDSCRQIHSVQKVQKSAQIQPEKRPTFFVFEPPTPLAARQLPVRPLPWTIQGPRAVHPLNCHQPPPPSSDTRKAAAGPGRPGSRCPKKTRQQTATPPPRAAARVPPGHPGAEAVGLGPQSPTRRHRKQLVCLLEVDRAPGPLRLCLGRGPPWADLALVATVWRLPATPLPPPLLLPWRPFRAGPPRARPRPRTPQAATLVEAGQGLGARGWGQRVAQGCPPVAPPTARFLACLQEQAAPSPWPA